MSPERLLQYFERISEAPDAIPRLRRFVLDLAVRGKLVEQDPEDGSAEQLLARVASKKQTGMGRGRRTPSNTATKTSLAGSHVTPDTWAWTKALAPVVLISDKGKKVKTKDVLQSGEFPVVDQGKILIRGYCNDPSKVISLDSPVIVFGDHTRETKFVDFDFVVGADGVKILQPLLIDARYYFLAIQWLPIESRGYGRHFKILRESLLPLPPLAEQHRIVAKVDELMALCDELEAAQAKREDRRDRLVAATLHGLNNGDTEPGPDTALDFSESARFYLNHLPRLTTRPEHIHQLRKTILNLAVRGKLVPQDPDDEPAEVLLKRLNRSRAQVGKRSRDVPTDGDVVDRSKFPSTWVTVPLLTLGPWAVGSGFPKNEQGHRDGPHFFLKVSDMNLPGNEKHIVSAQNTIDEAAVKRMRARLHPPGTIIFPKIGGAIATNKRRILTRPSAIDNNCLGITCLPELCIDWCYLLLCSLDFTVYQAGTAVPALQQGTLGQIAIGLPPLAEQRRIVAKVDELMALCDELEAHLTTAATTRARLLDATLHEALNGARDTPEAAMAD